MSDSSEKPWFDGPSAPRIPYLVRLEEKTTLASVLFGAICYGIVIVLFFRCMIALLNPINRARRDVKWSLVAHTILLFSCVTVFAGSHLHIQSISFIDNRGFHGSTVSPPGPIGYEYLLLEKTISLIPGALVLLSNWLADGLLLYRCYVIYSSWWATALPGVMFLSSFATGILLLYQDSRPLNTLEKYNITVNFGILHLSLAVSLNVLLTSMIVVRLFLHSRKLRIAIGTSAMTGGLYNAIIAMLVESCALSTITILVYVGLRAANNPVSNVFFPVLIQIQAIAPFFITVRVANQRTSTIDTAPGDISSVHFRNYGNTVAENETLLDGCSTDSGVTLAGLGVAGRDS